MNEKKKKCQYCGAHLSDFAFICPVCGALEPRDKPRKMDLLERVIFLLICALLVIIMLEFSAFMVFLL
ncbi:hypothetical protein [Escherichia coli]|uniref:hypothetical protein n=1 Tax=Escherichia coli TaxID=562 RepID=UPI00397E8C5F